MRQNSIRFQLSAVVLAIVATASCAAFLLAQPSSPPSGKGRQSLEAAIMAVPGCLGMKQAKTRDGAEVSLIWFKNTEAVLKWYHSEAHQEVMNKYFRDVNLREPLGDIAADAGPLLVIASFTRAKTPQKRLPLFSQFAVEIYQPLKGGLFVGDTLAPKDARIEGLREFPNE